MVGRLQQFLQSTCCVAPVSVTAEAPAPQSHAPAHSRESGISRLHQLGARTAARLNGAFSSPASLQFEQTLAQWVRAAPAIEVVQRKEAARRISVAYRKHNAVLDLGKLNLTTLPSCLRDLSSLQILNIRLNRLSSLPDLPPFLQRLMTQKNRLLTLPILPATLRELHAGHNALTSLPPIPQWVTLLHVDYNRIERLDPFPSGLVSFSAAHNLLDELPFLPPTLRRLIVGDNRLRYLPSLQPVQQAGESTWICLIDVSDNALSDLPDSFESGRPFGRFDNNPWSTPALGRLAALPGATIIDDRREDGVQIVVNNRAQWESMMFDNPMPLNYSCGEPGRSWTGIVDTPPRRRSQVPVTVRVPPPPVFMLLPPEIKRLVECNWQPNRLVDGADESMFNNFRVGRYTEQVVWCENAGQALWPLRPEVVTLRRQYNSMVQKMMFTGD